MDQTDKNRLYWIRSVAIVYPPSSKHGEQVYEELLGKGRVAAQIP